jgi:hypothetical protein
VHSLPLQQVLFDHRSSSSGHGCDDSSSNPGGDAIDVGGQWVGPRQTRVRSLAHTLGLQLVKQRWFEDLWGSELSSNSVVQASTAVGPPLNAATGRSGTDCADALTRGPQSLASGGLQLQPAEQQELECAMRLMDDMAAHVEVRSVALRHGQGSTVSNHACQPMPHVGPSACLFLDPMRMWRADDGVCMPRMHTCCCYYRRMRCGSVTLQWLSLAPQLSPGPASAQKTGCSLHASIPASPLRRMASAGVC